MENAFAGKDQIALDLKVAEDYNSSADLTA